MASTTTYTCDRCKKVIQESNRDLHFVKYEIEILEDIRSKRRFFELCPDCVARLNLFIDEALKIE